MVAATLPDLDTLTLDALKALVVAQHERLLTRDREVEHLKLLIARLQRMQFGRKSEKLARQIEQLELRLEELQSEPGEDSSPETKPSAPSNKDQTAAKPVRRQLPEHLPRQTRRHEPKASACPDCGGVLRKLGEDLSEMLEYVPASFFVIRHVRTTLSCSCCERILQVAAPSRPIERGMPGPGLLAHVLTSKYGDHLPLYRQSEILGTLTPMESSDLVITGRILSANV